MQLLQIMAYMIEQPFVAAVPFVFFLILYFSSRKRLVLVTALLWLGYVPYEWAMKLRLLCSGECNIRVDLLLIYPLLIVLSVIALIIAGSVLSKQRK